MQSGGEIALRPHSLGEILDQAIRLYRHNFLFLVGIIALAEIPFLLVQVALSLWYAGDAALAGSSSGDLFSLHWFITNAVSFSMHWVFVDGLGGAVLTYAVARRYFHLDAGVLHAYGRSLSSWPKLLANLFVCALLLGAVCIWFLVPCLGWFSAPGVLVFLAAAVMPFIPAAVVLERQAGFNAILRAWDLARRRFFWILGFNLVLILFNWILFAGPSLLVTFLASGIIDSLPGQTVTLDTIFPLVSSVTGTLFSALFLPIQMAAWTILYFDLRVRTEAFDLALMAMNDPEDAQHLVTLPALKKWITAADVAKMFWVSGMVIALIILINLLPFLLVFLVSALTPP